MKKNSIKVRCANCEQEIWRRPFELKKKYEHFFCNKKCQGEYQTRYRKGKNGLAYKGGLTRVRCQYCGKIFRVKPSKIKYGRGKYCSRECARKARIGSNLPFEWITKIKNTLLKNPPFKGKHQTKEVIAFLVNHSIEQWKNPEFRKNRRKQLIEQWKDPDYRDRAVRAIMKGNSIKPNKPEKLLITFLNHILPNEYRYVGDGQFILSGKCPDFLNINGKKKLIELFGNYWHSKKITGIKPKQHEEERINHFQQFGFDTLIIWERELKNLNKVANQITQFTNS